MWKKKYHELYFRDTRDIESQAEASILKEENFPKILFKYMKAKHAIGSLKDDFIKVSDPFHVNDPFEGDMLFDYDMISQQYKDDLLILQLDVPVFNLSDEDKNLIVNSENPLDSFMDIVYNNDSGWGEGLTMEEFKLEFVEIFDEFAQYSVKNYNHELKKKMLFVCLSESNNIIPMWHIMQTITQEYALDMTLRILSWVLKKHVIPFYMFKALILQRKSITLTMMIETN